MTMRDIKGGCHCGALHYVAGLDLAAPSYRCNCSICTRSRVWLIFTPHTGFRMVAGAETMQRYRFGAERISHCFCPVCGVKTHAETTEGVAVMVATLDLSPGEFAGLTVNCIDGAHDNFRQAPAISSYL